MSHKHLHNLKSIHLQSYIYGVAALWALIVLGIWAYVAMRPPETLRIMWAEWEPSDVLSVMLEDFTEETGIPAELIQVPWADFQTAAYRDLDKSEPEYDIIIGDSQWLGRNVERGERYLDLTPYYERYKWHEEFLPLALSAYGEYPAMSGKYHALPVLGDSMGFAYRRDLFEDEGNRNAFRLRYGRELIIPQTWDELYDVAEFFYRPEEELFGLSMATSVQYSSLTMSFESILFSFGGDVGNRETLQSDGYINSIESEAALEFFKKLYKLSIQSEGGHSDSDGARAEFMHGRSALLLNFFSLMPQAIAEGSGPYHDSIGFFVVPEGPGGRIAALGGQGASIVHNSHNREAALKWLEWWGKKETQIQWADAGGISVHNAARNIDNLSSVRPYFAPQQQSLLMMKDFWVVPEYPELLDVSQRRLDEYLKGATTAKVTLDQIASEWDEIFETSPYNILRR